MKKRSLSFSLKNWLAIALVIMAIILRFLPHVPNFIPIIALAMFAGVYFSSTWAYLLPLAAMIIFNIFLGFYSTMIFVYGSLLLTVAIGQFVKSRKNPLVILARTLTGSITFLSPILVFG